jgi:hypothetical protein
VSISWRAQRILDVATKYGWQITPSKAVDDCWTVHPAGTESWHDQGFTVYAGPNGSATVMRQSTWEPVSQRDTMSAIASSAEW